MAFLVLILAALMAVGVYECRKGIKDGDRRSARIWGVIATVMAGLLVYVLVTPPEWVYGN